MYVLTYIWVVQAPDLLLCKLSVDPNPKGNQSKVTSWYALRLGLSLKPHACLKIWHWNSFLIYLRSRVWNQKPNTWPFPTSSRNWLKPLCQQEAHRMRWTSRTRSCSSRWNWTEFSPTSSNNTTRNQSFQVVPVLKITYFGRKTEQQNNAAIEDNSQGADCGYGNTSPYVDVMRNIGTDSVIDFLYDIGHVHPVQKLCSQWSIVEKKQQTSFQATMRPRRGESKIEARLCGKLQRSPLDGRTTRNGTKIHEIVDQPLNITLKYRSPFHVYICYKHRKLKSFTITFAGLTL